MKTIKFECPECQRVHTARVGNAGKKAKCTCGTRVTVPDNGSELSIREQSERQLWPANAENLPNETLAEILKCSIRTTIATEKIQFYVGFQFAITLIVVILSVILWVIAVVSAGV